MPLNDHDPPNPLPDGTGFKTVDTISATERPLSEVLSCILEHEEAGIPLVIAGLSADPNWLPFPQPHPSEVEAHGGIGQRRPSTVFCLSRHIGHRSHIYKTDRDEGQGSQPPAFTWASGLSRVPKYLLPPGPKETLSITVEHLQGEGDPDGAGATGFLMPSHHRR